MPRSLITATVLLALVPAVRAQDTISPNVVVAVKRATVYVRVDAGNEQASGSGFVVAAERGIALIVTNHHVAIRRVVDGMRPPTVTVVFDSGTPTERSYRAEIVGSDVENDLAFLKVRDVQNAPTPIPCVNAPAPYETMSVYSFGFPFGQDLAGGNNSPAITVGRASVSSLRKGPDGNLTAIQIDGNLNPGNSGGPVVDARGRLIGVAVAILKKGQGIGFLVPTAEVVQGIRGRIGHVRVTAKKGVDGKPVARVEADLIDPANTFGNATVYYVVVPPKGEAPDVPALNQYPGSQKLPLKLDNGSATCEFAMENLDGRVFVQVVAERRLQGQAVVTPVQGLSLYPGPKPEELTGPPPDLWTNYVPKSEAFAVWLPEKPALQEEQQREHRVNGEMMRINSVQGVTANGLTYTADHIVLPPGLARYTPVTLHALFRSILLDGEDGEDGRLTESIEAKSGTLFGVQYRIEYGNGEVDRARVFIDMNRVVRIVRVTGTAQQVNSTEAETILMSFRLPNDKTVGKTPAPPAGGTPPGGTTPPVAVAPRQGAEPTVLAGGRSPLFKDGAPEGGLLIGLEITPGKFGPFDTIKSVRPIYRVDGKEEFGEQHGIPPATPVTLKAKDGYAVGAMTCVWGLNFDGCSLTFMKVKDGKLDQSDAYESEWVGQVTNKRRTRLGGDGTPVIGIAGRGSEREVNGLGLLFADQKGSDPNSPVQANGPHIFGSIRDPMFKSVGPEGGILIGLEAKFTKFGSEDIVRAVRPIYHNGDKEEHGPLTGKNLDGAVTLKAKDGYAVGGMAAKAGWWCNGFSLTFMRIKADGTLDPKDSYESEWIGWNGERQIARITGDGKPVVGLVGKIVRCDTTALGLLFKGQEDFDHNQR